MATVYLAPLLNGTQFFDDNGAPLNGGFVNTYAAGTTTPQATFTTQAGTVQNANPIALNSAGRLTTQVWLSAATAYKFVPVSSVSVAVGITQDNIYGIGDPATQANIGVTGATVSGALTMNLAPINEAQGANIPVAAQINLTTASGNYLSLTGSGTVTALQLSQGAYRELVVNTVSGAFVNSNTLALIGQSSFTPAVGDILGFRGEAPPVVRQVLFQRASGAPPFPIFTTVSNTLSANVNLTNSTAFVDGPSVNCGTTGIWLVSAVVTLADAGGGQADFSGKLYDGTTIQASAVQSQSQTSSAVSMYLGGIFTNPAGNIRVAVRNASSNTGNIIANNTTLGKDSTIMAVRIG